jgi:hypothetical protein
MEINYKGFHMKEVLEVKCIKIIITRWKFKYKLNESLINNFCIIFIILIHTYRLIFFSNQFYIIALIYG